MARFHSCNVLQSTGSNRQLWQFGAVGSFALKAEHVSADGSLPAGLAQKNWPQLWQPRLNVAWLPPQEVFFRVVHLPASSREEVVSMVELQLEKLSPAPVGQVVWSVFSLPAAEGAAASDLQAHIVVFVERRVVEEYLGELEAAGYLADRLELKALDQITATEIDSQGAWIFPGLAGGPNTALVAWWYGGRLQSLTLLNMPTDGDQAESLKEQLAQAAWSGELEGWLTALPAWTLVADEETSAQWEQPLRQGLDSEIRVVLPAPATELASRTAKRAVTSDVRDSLIPVEFATRYRNQFFDRLWIRGAFALGAAYFVLIAIYFAAVSVQQYRVDKVEARADGLGPTYTNALQLRERFQVLKTREELKFAALDCWKSTADLLPTTLTVDRFALSDGRRLVLDGSAPGDAAQDIIKFWNDIKKSTINGEALFNANEAQSPNTRVGPGGVVNWSFTLELNRTEEER